MKRGKVLRLLSRLFYLPAVLAILATTAYFHSPTDSLRKNVLAVVFLWAEYNRGGTRVRQR